MHKVGYFFDRVQKHTGWDDHLSAPRIGRNNYRKAYWGHAPINREIEKSLDRLGSCCSDAGPSYCLPVSGMENSKDGATIPTYPEKRRPEKRELSRDSKG